MKLLMLRKLHKWAALVVGVQLFLWALSGLMFAWLDHHEVQGHEVVVHVPAPVLSSEQQIVDPALLLKLHGGPDVTAVRLTSVGGVWVYRLQSAGAVELFAAADGARFRVDREFAAELARGYYRGNGVLDALSYHAGPTQETRKAGATWEAQFSDAQATSVYVSAEDGSLVVARGTSWRIFDFFWMLHTMDYVGRDDFNNPLVIMAGTVGVWIALTGLLLVFRVFRPRRSAT